MTLPAPTIEPVGRWVVVREDLLPGGTKRRILDPLIESRQESVFAYASPAWGYAQIALAHACARFNRRAVVFVAKRNQPHGCMVDARRAGAEIRQIPAGYMSVLRARLRDFCSGEGAFEVPFGAACNDYVDRLVDAARSLDVSPPEVWAVAGSGTLTRALQSAWPDARHHAVRVGGSCDVGSARLWHAPEQFSQPCRGPLPPFPSSLNYDAKAWRFFKRWAVPGSLFWNVGA